MRALNIPFSVVLGALLIGGCAAEADSPEPGGKSTLPQDDLVKPEDGKADSSYLAVFLDFEFEAEVLVSSNFGLEKKIESQLLYTIGQLNGDKSVGNLNKLELTDIRTESAGDKTLVKYKAKLPVAWGKRNDVPESYTLKLPRDGTFSGFESFTEKYSHDCVDWGAHDVTSGSMWYYYRPEASRCEIDPSDIVTAEASITPSASQTTGKYPEYDKVWEDEHFRAVAIFGKNEDGATSSSDAGISAYNSFVREVKKTLTPHGLTTTPEEIPDSPGVEVPDVVLEGTLPDGKLVTVTALLVDNVRTAGATFDKRYEALSTDADFIVYNGHAGLGANIRALADKGKWRQGQYAVVLVNGCDTYAYVDNKLWDAHAAVNPDDPTGTKYLDIATNAMPAFFSQLRNTTMAFVNALMNPDEPQTFEQIFKIVDPSQIILVSGEEDNAFVPGGGGGNPVDWDGMEESGSVERNQEVRFETPTLKAGSYSFDLSGDNDADLYVRVGEAPTKSLYDCRPYKYGSKESCKVEITTPAPVHVMVRGWAQSSEFTLSARPE